ncbi:hypothetical protein Tco_0601486, partial [Tanacetum coccineum]
DKLISGDKSLDLSAFKLSRLFFSLLSSRSSSCWRSYGAQREQCKFMWNSVLLEESNMTKTGYILDYLVKLKEREGGHVKELGNFVIASFNNARHLFNSKFTECKYLKSYNAYHFYMIIEAIKEGNPGTYMAEVICNRYGSVGVLPLLTKISQSLKGIQKSIALSEFSRLEKLYREAKEGLGRRFTAIHLVHLIVD